MNRLFALLSLFVFIRILATTDLLSSPQVGPAVYSTTDDLNPTGTKDDYFCSNSGRGCSNAL